MIKQYEMGLLPGANFKVDFLLKEVEAKLKFENARSTDDSNSNWNIDIM